MPSGKPGTIWTPSHQTTAATTAAEVAAVAPDVYVHSGCVAYCGRHVVKDNDNYISIRLHHSRFRTKAGRQAKANRAEGPFWPAKVSAEVEAQKTDTLQNSGGDSRCFY